MSPVMKLFKLRLIIATLRSLFPFLKFVAPSDGGEVDKGVWKKEAT